MTTIKEMREFLNKQKGKVLTDDEFAFELNGVGLICLKEAIEKERALNKAKEKNNVDEVH